MVVWELDKSSQTMYHGHMEKICGRCKVKKNIGLFNKRSAARDGFSAWCKQCFADYDRDRYQTVDKERKDRNRQTQVWRKQNLLWEMLITSECKACGNTDPEVLEFDHRDGEDKKFNVSEMMYSYSWASILSEIAKCDILCANCHRKRTIKQFGFWRGNQLPLGKQ